MKISLGLAVAVMFGAASVGRAAATNGPSPAAPYADLASAPFARVVAPLEPISPTDCAECDALRERWQAELDRLEEEHQKCLDTHEVDPDYAADHTCSRPSCQDLHDERGFAQHESELSINRCIVAVRRHVEQVAQEREEAARREAEEAASRMAREREASERAAQQQVEEGKRAERMKAAQMEARRVGEEHDKKMAELNARLSALDGQLDEIQNRIAGEDRTLRAASDALAQRIGSELDAAAAPGQGTADAMSDFDVDTPQSRDDHPLDVLVDTAFQEGLDRVEHNLGSGQPDPVSQVLDATLDDVPSGSTGGFKLALQSAVAETKEQVIAALRSAVGHSLCRDDETTGDAEVDAAARAFYSGVCGGWVGRPISPSGIYGYLKENIVDGWDKMFHVATRHMGLMDDEPE